MATITPTSLTGPGQRTGNLTILAAGDTFTYVQGSGQILILTNGTAGALSPTITSGAASINFPGAPAVNVTTYAIGSIPVGQSRVIPLDTIAAYLVNGTISLAACVGISALLLNPQP